MAGGEVLFREGEPSDSIYLLLTGRPRAIVENVGGDSQEAGEIGRGESVGEMGVFSGESRRATVTALRDSVLVRVELAAFHAILNAAPSLALNLNRVIIERLQRRNTSQKPRRNVTNIAVISVSEGLQSGSVIQQLLSELQGQEQTVMHRGSLWQPEQISTATSNENGTIEKRRGRRCAMMQGHAGQFNPLIPADEAGWLRESRNSKQQKMLVDSRSRKCKLADKK